MAEVGFKSVHDLLTTFTGLQAKKVCKARHFSLCRRFSESMEPKSHLRTGQSFRSQSVFVAAKTSSAWPLTDTLRQTCRTMPEPSIRKVARSMPIYSRP